jgi:hypothetical protein
MFKVKHNTQPFRCVLCLTLKSYLLLYNLLQGWIQYDLIGGGGALGALVPSCVGHVYSPPINLLDYCKVLLDYCI